MLAGVTDIGFHVEFKRTTGGSVLFDFVRVEAHFHQFGKGLETAAAHIVRGIKRLRVTGNEKFFGRDGVDVLALFLGQRAHLGRVQHDRLAGHRIGFGLQFGEVGNFQRGVRFLEQGQLRRRDLRVGTFVDFSLILCAPRKYTRLQKQGVLHRGIDQ